MGSLGCCPHLDAILYPQGNSVPQSRASGNRLPTTDRLSRKYGHPPQVLLGTDVSQQCHKSTVTGGILTAASRLAQAAPAGPPQGDRRKLG